MDKNREVVIEWKAPSRIYKKRGKEYFSTIAAIVFLLTIVLAIAREFLLIGVIYTFAFFVYVLATVKPEKIKNQFTKKGIRIANSFYRWEELTDFWTEEKHGYTVVHVIMPFRPPGRIILLVDKGNKDEVLKILSKKLVFHEEPIKSWVDRAADWLTSKIKLEKSTSSNK
jgi:hypothetical protein